VEQHVKILGVLNIVWGAMVALGGLVLLVIFGGAYGIAGAAIGYNPGAHIALPVIAIIGSVLALVFLLLSVPSIIAGIGLLYFKPWARILALVISALHLFNIPIGTALVGAAFTGRPALLFFGSGRSGNGLGALRAKKVSVIRLGACPKTRSDRSVNLTRPSSSDPAGISALLTLLGRVQRHRLRRTVLHLLLSGRNAVISISWPGS
jgi:hypothetical protein